MDGNVNMFVGHLLSIETKNVFYQGIVNKIDLQMGCIYLKNCFQNGLSCGDKLVEIKITEIDNIEILADPVNAINFFKPKAFVNSNTTTNNNNNNGSHNNNGNDLNDARTNNKPDVKITNSSSSSSSNHVTRVSNSSSDDYDFKKPKSISSADESNYPNRRKNYSYNDLNGHNDRHHNNNNHHHHNHHNQSHHNHNDHFDAVNVNSLKGDFDFEKNLALFDKNAFYEEMGTGNNQSRSDVVSQPSPRMPAPPVTMMMTINPHQPAPANNTHSSNSSGSNGLSKNYRYDEMILDTGEPINFQQIQVPSCSHLTKKYVTDEGFIIPCIDQQLRDRLFEESHKYGLSRERQIECMARCCTDMALQLVGGSVRFSVKNSHQKPSFLVLVNCNSIQGLYALSTARFLSNKNAKIYLIMYHADLKNTFLHDQTQLNENSFDDKTLFVNELNLFLSTDTANYRIIKSIDELTQLKAIDLILNGIESHSGDKSSPPLQSQQWFRSLTKYIDTSKASVLTIDPTSQGSVINSKWCISPGLPFAFTNNNNCGRVYLCDIGFTRKMFQSVQVNYCSPFGSKFLIPLHND